MNGDDEHDEEELEEEDEELLDNDLILAFFWDEDTRQWTAGSFRYPENYGESEEQRLGSLTEEIASRLNQENLPAPEYEEYEEE